MHAPGRHSPDTQEPSQQSFVPVQAPPAARQLATRHTPPAHVDPVQQSSVVRHPPPGIEQPPMAVHWPPTHSPEQHSAGFTHASPAPPHVHAPLRHSPLQHSFDDSHPSTSGLHSAWQTPMRHSPRQHSDVIEHAVPRSLHVAFIDVVPQPRANIARSAARRIMPGRLPHRSGETLSVGASSDMKRQRPPRLDGIDAPARRSHLPLLTGGSRR